VAENLPKLTPEELSAIAQLVRSPGWRVLMEKLFIPEIVQVTRHIDNITADDRATQMYRGAKLTLTRIMQTVYRWGRLTNPIEEHYTGLLTAVRIHTEDFVNPDKDPWPTPTVHDVTVPPRRVSKPVF